MTIQEFSDSFDVLVSSYDVKASFGDQVSREDIAFNEYEKSVFLTLFQEELITSLYNGRTALATSFEETEEMRRYLANIVMESKLNPIDNSSGTLYGMGSNSKFFTLPSDVWFITYESIAASDSKCEALSNIEVVPVTQDEYHKVKKNPFRGANSRRALRLDLADGVVEIVSTYNISSYYLRYLRKPQPIILTDLSGTGLTINNKTGPLGCELHEALHNKILDGAVTMALQSKIKTTNSNSK